MKTLFLMRHAKSSWADKALADIDRPLNERGLKAAPFMGKLMHERGFNPYIIITSTAIRARHTATLVKEAGKLVGLLHFEPKIYEASPQGLSQVVAAIDDINLSAMIVGHNPGLEGFIRFLTGEVEPMPTAALAVIDLNILNWESVKAGCGKLQALIRPSDEMQ